MASKRGPPTTPPIAGMWAQLQKENRLPKSAVLSSCESELQELMRQIDLMVHAKKAEWDRERQKQQAKLDIKEQEFLIQRSTLDAKHNEIGQLRAQIDLMEKQRIDKSTEYEKQLGSLRNEVARMKKEYDRLQKKYDRHAKEVEREKTKTSTEIEDRVEEIKRLNNKLEEGRKKSRESDQEKRSLQKKLEEVESQNKTMREKLGFLQQQSTTYQMQLDKRSEILGTTEVTLQAQISELEGQLQRARDTINSQDTQLSRLKGGLDDALGAQRSALQDKEGLERDLGRAQNNVRHLEEANNQLRLQLAGQEATARSAREAQQAAQAEGRHLQDQLTDAQRTLRQYEGQQISSSDGRVRELQDDLHQAHSDLRKSKKAEKQLREDVRELTERLECLHMLEAEPATAGDQGLARIKAKYKKLQEELEQTKVQYEAQLSVLQAQLEQQQLQQGGGDVAISQQQLERRLGEQQAAIERKEAELTVTSAQLEALRVENRALRRAALSRGTGGGSAVEAEDHLQQMHAAYNNSLAALEKQNEQLKSQISYMQQKLENSQSSAQFKVEQVVKDSEKTVNQVRQDENRRLCEVREDCERQMRDMDQRLQDTVAEYEAKISAMQAEYGQLEDEIDLRSRTLKRLGMENAVMENFVAGVDEIAAAPPRRPQDAASYSPSPRTISPSSLIDDNEGSDICLVDSADVATAQFLAEQNQRSRELEHKLNLHIEDLKATTDATIRKYTAR